MRNQSAPFFIAGACAVAAICFFSSMPPLLASSGRGKELFEKRCTGCHAMDHEKSGPRLRGVFGRPAGTVATFKYSDAIRKSGVTWDGSSLEKWLTDPDAFVPDNDMAFRVADAGERAAIIEYLKESSQKGS